MKLKELLEILDEHVELVVYDCDGLRTMHLYDKNYFYNFYEEFIKKKIIHIKPYGDCKAVLKVYLEDYYDTSNSEEEILWRNKRNFFLKGV